MEFPSNWRKKYPNFTHTDRSIYNKKTLAGLYWYDDPSNCGAVILRNGGSSDPTVNQAFDDLCSINGIGLVYGTCYSDLFLGKEKFGYIKVVEYDSPKNDGVMLTHFYKVIDTLQKGYGIYTQELS